MTYRLTYFNARGRGEVARLLFTAAGIKFEDKRIQGAEWLTLKEKTPQGTLPILEVNDGKTTLVISQSMSINRYIAREFNLYGKDNYQQTVVDEVLDTCVDMFLPILKLFSIKDEEEKKKEAAAYRKDKIPVCLGFIEALIKENGKDGFIVGSSLTMADLGLLSYIENCQIQDCLDDYPGIVKNQDTVRSLPRIKKYLEIRPQTSF